MRPHPVVAAHFIHRKEDIAMTATLGEQITTVTLYERLGGAAGIRALVDGIVDAHLCNPVIEARFRPYLDRPERVAEIKRHTCAFLSEGSGGPDTYRGRSMAEAHRGMGISDAEYDAAAGDILATLARHGHGAATQAEVGAMLAALRDEIVEAERGEAECADALTDGTTDGVETRRFEQPDQALDMKERGGIHIVRTAAGSTGMYAIFEPGWTWERDEKPLLGSPETCPMHHTGYCITGTLEVRMVQTGQVARIRPGDFFEIPPGHDAHVDGNERVEMVLFEGPEHRH
jgi:truncated hemoglobin YjbI